MLIRPAPDLRASDITDDGGGKEKCLRNGPERRQFWAFWDFLAAAEKGFGLANQAGVAH